MHAHGRPLSPQVRETIDLWVSDFGDRPAFREAAGPLGAHAPTVLASFLEAACHGGRAPADLEAGDVSHALLDHLPLLDLPPAAQQALPALVAAFLGDLQDVGRLADGRGLAAAVRAAAPSFRERASGRGANLTRPGAKIGRNDPCPCGSGKKYKTCCLNALG
jgi:hypothetical protein